MMTTRLAGGIALVLVVLSMLLLVAFQTVEIVHNRVSLAETREAQEKSLQEAAKARHQFETLSAGVVELAAAGDPGAKTVIEELRRDGITLAPAKR